MSRRLALSAIGYSAKPFTSSSDGRVRVSSQLKHRPPGNRNPLPNEIQNTTTYAAGISAAAKDKNAAEELIKYLSGPDAAAVLKSKGMDPAK